MGRHEWDTRLKNRAWEAYNKVSFFPSSRNWVRKSNVESFKDATGVNNVYMVAILFVKMSILLLYLRTFSQNRTLRLTVYVVLFFLVTTHALTFPLYFSSTTPLDCQWRPFETDEDYYAHCTEHFDQRTYLVFIAAFTIVLDVVILSIPCPTILRLNMAKRQRIAILVILLAGVVY